jgi:hypothetical protein
LDEKMNRLMNTLVFVLLSLVALVATVILWPFAVAGFLALLISGMKFNRWVSSSLALVLVVVWRIVTGGWIVRIGDSTPEHWYYETLPGIVSWALASILVPGFAQWPAKFLEGYRSRLSKSPESPPKESEAKQAAP